MEVECRALDCAMEQQAICLEHWAIRLEQKPPFGDTAQEDLPVALPSVKALG